MQQKQNRLLVTAPRAETCAPGSAAICTATRKANSSLTSSAIRSAPRLSTWVTTLVAVLLLSVVPAAQAKGFKGGFFKGSGFYSGGFAISSYIALDGSAVNIENSLGDDVNSLGGRLRLGTRLSEYFDIEAQLGGGSDSSEEVFDELRASYFGVYLKGYLPLGRRSALFALAGSSAVRLTQTIGNRDLNDDTAGFSFGAGLETQLTNRLDLSADFMQYSLGNNNFADVSAFNLGLKLYF